MITQKFEQISDQNQLTLVVDMLRYENAAQTNLIETLENEVAALREEVERQKAQQELLQVVIDSQSAALYARVAEKT